MCEYGAHACLSFEDCFQMQQCCQPCGMPILIPAPQIKPPPLRKNRENKTSLKKAPQKKETTSITAQRPNRNYAATNENCVIQSRSSTGRKVDGKKYSVTRLSKDRASNSGGLEKPLNYSNTGFDENCSADKNKEPNSNGILSNDDIIGVLQRSMDQTMRAYFMHTMEKLECLSAQLLRNEYICTKMHLDIIEKTSILCKRSTAQFQALLVRINSILGDKNRQSNDPPLTNTNSEEDEFGINFNVIDFEGNDLKTYGFSNNRKSKALSREKLNMTETLNNLENDFKEETNEIDTKMSENLNYNEQDGGREIESYKMCQKRIQCLQDALNKSLKDLENNLNRIKGSTFDCETDDEKCNCTNQNPNNPNTRASQRSQMPNLLDNAIDSFEDFKRRSSARREI